MKQKQGRNYQHTCPRTRTHTSTYMHTRTHAQYLTGLYQCGSFFFPKVNIPMVDYARTPQPYELQGLSVPQKCYGFAEISVPSTLRASWVEPGAGSNLMH